MVKPSLCSRKSLRPSAFGLRRTTGSAFSGPPRSGYRGITLRGLQRHAVPLDEHHLTALSHSAMALDVYAWLSQRLHRIEKGRGVPLPWTAVAEQFGGSGYERIRKFRDNFKVALAQVQTVYKSARVDVSGRGLMLWNSPPPVPPQTFPSATQYSAKQQWIEVVFHGHFGAQSTVTLGRYRGKTSQISRSLWGAIL